MATTRGREAVKPLVWKSCDDGDCARLTVPLRHADPTGETIELVVARGSLADPDKRIGTLLLNPGGPGAPGTDFVVPAAKLLPDAITDYFDIVSWDPRGTGESSPVDCGRNFDYLFAADSAPDNAVEHRELEAAAARFARECSQRSSRLLPNVTSLATVSDMDMLREALGEDKLTYLGFSYGTYLGALYAREFPERVRAMMLDGAVDPSLSVETMVIEQAQGFGRALDLFLAYCARNRDCAFHHGGEPRGALDALRARVDLQPIASGDRTLGPTQLDLALGAGLYGGELGYTELARSLRDAERGDPDGLLAGFDAYVGRNPDGIYKPDWAAFISISCADGPVLDLEAARVLQESAAVAAPDFGAESVGLGFPCSFWSAPPTNKVPGVVVASGSVPIVVIGATDDPATPLKWSEGLAKQLGVGRLVAVRGSAHTSLLGGPDCLARLAAVYLVDLVVPQDGTRC